ncbi:kunitz type trypsin inhibitor 104-like [Gastrolobium bilobum]|uniref:kunitz type trypsin inhibitor 104-like n=1 Tax=Gastrolobium bilobum TaxID=150636 RepID=UPI002AB084A0|nr:kunitz type trypsin inhibitor 104-like [Gastrolobium bilobum]
MSMRLLGSLSLVVWLFMVTASLAQSDNTYVLDTNGDPIERDEEYYIKPAITDNGGRFTLINRNGSCPLNVGLENTDLPKGLRVIFTPFAKEDKDVKVNRDFKVAFSASTTCVQSTEWRVGQNDTRSGRRLIITGKDDGRGWGNYFRIVETQFSGIYNIQWCPTDVCPTCRFRCGTAGILRENGKILLALDGGVLPVVFQKEKSIAFSF